jgi:arylsulfatase
LRVPKIFNLRTDPYERADITSNTYYDWLLDHAFLLVPAVSDAYWFSRKTTVRVWTRGITETWTRGITRVCTRAMTCW